MQSMKWKEITTEEALLLSDLGVDVYCTVRGGGGTVLNLGAIAKNWRFDHGQRAYIQRRDIGPWYIPDDDD